MKGIETFRTDAGNLTKSNLAYLLRQGVLLSVEDSFVISGEVVQSSEVGSIRLWSLYSLTLQAFREKATSKRLNATLKRMREKVSNLKGYGLKLAIEAKESSGYKKGVGRKSDFDWGF